jgi:glycosyltransferase involved in cell wall biosynthesis
MTQRLLSIVMPCFNESSTVPAILDALAGAAARLESGLSFEVIVVDDASTDGSFQRILEVRESSALPIKVVRHEVNRGKGASIRTARDHVSGDLVLVQDADLEYDPEDIPQLLQPLLEGRADAVVGSRFLGSGAHRVLYFWHRVGNGVVTLLSNMTTNLNLTDIEVGYKAFTAEAFRTMHLTRDRFGVEPEIVARLAQMGARVYEAPVRYHGRTYEEGKKITWVDGLAAMWHIVHSLLTSGRQRRLGSGS